MYLVALGNSDEIYLSSTPPSYKISLPPQAVRIGLVTYQSYSGYGSFQYSMEILHPSFPPLPFIALLLWV